MTGRSSKRSSLYIINENISALYFWTCETSDAQRGKRGKHNSKSDLNCFLFCGGLKNRSLDLTFFSPEIDLSILNMS